MNKSITIAIIFLIIQSSITSQNLIYNGDCELPLVGGEIDGWVEVTSTTWQPRFTDPLPQSGDRHFFPGANSFAELSQDIDVSSFASEIDAGTQLFNFTGYVRCYGQSPPDESNIILEYMDNSGTILSTYDSGELSSSGVWLLLENETLAPVNTRTIKIRLLSTRNVGTNNDGYYDNLSLIANSTLPLLYEYFTCATFSKSINLSWKTSEEHDNYGFDIERLNNNSEWEAIGFVQEKGFQSTTNIYKFVDNRPITGYNYYRLKQYDSDLSYSYSIIKNVFYNNESVVDIYPNPTNGVLHITNNSSSISEIKILDHLGQTVKEDILINEQNNATIDFSTLVNGCYFISIAKQNEFILKRIIKY